MLNQAILYVLVDHVHLKPLYAKVLAVILVLGWNFFGHRRFTFGPRMQNNYENT
jgi:putative flippase GtrA